MAEGCIFLLDRLASALREVDQLRAALSHCVAQAGPESCADVLADALDRVKRAERERDEAHAATARFADGIEAIRLERNDRDDDIALLLRDNAKLKDLLAAALADRDRLAAEVERLRRELHEALLAADVEGKRAVKAAHKRDDERRIADAAIAARDSALAERDEVVKKYDVLFSAYRLATEQVAWATKQRDSAVAERDEAVGARDSALRGQHTALDSRDVVAAAVQRDTAERIAAWLDGTGRCSFTVGDDIRAGAWRKDGGK